MSIHTEYNSLGCVAVNKDSMYAVIKGIQSTGHSVPLIALIKTEYPTIAFRNITWTVVSTTPWSYLQPNSHSNTAEWRLRELTCDMDNNGVFTLRFYNGAAAYRYISSATKLLKAQTCSSASDGLGEWRRTDLVEPEGITVRLGDSMIRLVFQEEDSVSTMSNSDGNQSGREMVVYYSYSLDSLDPSFGYRLVDKMAYRSRLGDLRSFRLTENLTTIEKLAYGEGQMYSVLGSGFPSLVPGTDRVTNSKTLLYFPFNPFNSSSILHKPPDSAIAVPWNVKCDAVRNSQPNALGFVAKGKFYYVCTVLEWVRPDPPYESHRVNLYIHDSKTIQTLGPFTIANISDITTAYPARILPVYGASLQDEPQFLVVSMYTRSTGSELPVIVDLHALDSPPQTWTEFGIPRSIPTNERLDPSCRTREPNKRLFIAGVVSVVFGIAAIALWIIRWWRQRTKGRMDKIPLATALVGEEKREAAEHSKGPQALIQDDNEP